MGEGLRGQNTGKVHCSAVNNTDCGPKKKKKRQDRQIIDVTDCCYRKKKPKQNIKVGKENINYKQMEWITLGAHPKPLHGVKETQ